MADYTKEHIDQMEVQDCDIFPEIENLIKNLYVNVKSCVISLPIEFSDELEKRYSVQLKMLEGAPYIFKAEIEFNKKHIVFLVSSIVKDIDFKAIDHELDPSTNFEYILRDDPFIRQSRVELNRRLGLHVQNLINKGWKIGLPELATMVKGNKCIELVRLLLDDSYTDDNYQHMYKNYIIPIESNYADIFKNIAKDVVDYDGPLSRVIMFIIESHKLGYCSKNI